MLDYINQNREVLKCDYNHLIKIPLPLLKELLLVSNEWHHTSHRYNITAFYELNHEIIDQLTNDELNVVYNEYKQRENKKKAQRIEQEEKDKELNGRWKISYTYRNGYDRHAKSKVLSLCGTVKDSWFYPDDISQLNGKHKLSIHSKHFSFVKRI